MRSLQSKFLALTVGCVLLTALALGYVGFLYTHKLVNEDSTQFMNLFCEDKAQEIDAALMGIEQSVNMSSITHSELVVQAGTMWIPL